jgi:Cys-rich repeat protein
VTCSADDQCASGVCGPSGSGTHCCSAGTTCPVQVAACGATDCSVTGGCVYPGTTVAPASLQTPGDCQTVVCNGSGGTTSIDDATDLPTSNSACLINPACCGPSPFHPCFTNAPTGTPCTSASDPNAHVCGDPSNPVIAGKCVECITDLNCPSGATPVCDITTGQCVSCVPAGDNVSSIAQCSSDCCNGGCVSGTTCL